MSWVEVKYASMLGHRLDRFKIKKRDPFLANCRCPFCGDSDFNKAKARGYILDKKGNVYFFCHNCGTSLSFGKFLKQIDQFLYNEYRLELLGNDVGGVKKVEKPALPMNDVAKKLSASRNGFGDLLKKISSLSADHYAKKYVDSRLIPPEQQYRLFYTDNFVRFAHWFREDVLIGVEEHPRLVIPFFDASKKLVGFTGRSFKKDDDKRYINIMLNEDASKVFGMDKADLTKELFVVEGPIDSLFLPNCIAMSGADLSIDGLHKDTTTFVFDNEPRNKSIVRLMEKRISQGYKVCIWPSAIKHKDINDMVLAGFPIEELSGIIFRNAFSEVEATLRLNEWRRD